MNSILKMLLTGLIDPVLWIKSMSTLGVRKNRTQCIFIFLIDYCLVLGKGIVERCNGGNIVRECAMFLIILYVIWATWYLFEGTFYEKIIHIFMFYCILIVTELSAMGIYISLYPENFDRGDKIPDVICGMVKILQGILCYYVFKENKTTKSLYQNMERLSLILVGFIILCNVYIEKAINKEGFTITTLLEIFFLCWYILSLVLALKGKNKHIGELEQKAKSSFGTTRQVSDIDQFRHDFSTNVFLLKNFWYYKDYEKLEHYMDTVFADVEKVKLLFEHPNFPVRIIVSKLIQMAERAGVPFSVQIEVNEFGMTDEDICTVFYNIGLNGLNLASEVPVKKAYVQLEALHNDTGYMIRCRRTCTREENRQQDERKDLESVAFGMELIDRIIKKYGGTVEKKKGKSQWKNIFEEEVILQIPYK